MLAQWHAHRRKLLVCCLRLLDNNWADADDALGDVLVKILRNDHRLAEIEDPIAWFYRLTFNSCMDILRARRREGLRRRRWSGDAQDTEELHSAAAVETSEQVYLRRELLQQLRYAVDALPKSLREALLLRADDVSYADIAARSDITQENARKRVQQARTQLRVELRLSREDTG